MLDVPIGIEPSIGSAGEVRSLSLHDGHLALFSLALLKESVLELDGGAFHDDGSAIVLQKLIAVSHAHLS